MTRRSLLLVLSLLSFTLSAFGGPPGAPITLVIHGGAGTINRGEMSPAMETEYRAVLERALLAGYSLLSDGRPAVDAVEAAIRVMEDSPHFNAGKGAVFTHSGTNELDATIMDGSTMKAGAVAVVTIVRNPISAARIVMERSEHVMLIGRGAELFATTQGVEIVDPSYFWTERRWRQLQKALVEAAPRLGRGYVPASPDRKFGTVGAVALDRQGHLAAGTSTGGMTNKQFGRVGDTPVIGAGTYASDRSCAVSATGHGEYFLRYTVARDIAALMEFGDMGVKEASEKVVLRTLVDAGGPGGVIALDRKGNYAMPFNTTGMYRGAIGRDGVPRVWIYEREK
ncbi:MAG: isoaspartyl peptidase/L-asparaginase [Acidobacteria bacterium]|nr:isoaspartyl peptidase/L-asparaginase [Acidobacteriota bacterium]